MREYGAEELLDGELSCGMSVANRADEFHFDGTRCSQNVGRFNEAQFFSAVVAELFGSS
jgi:hypothetical protein